MFALGEGAELVAKTVLDSGRVGNDDDGVEEERVGCQCLLRLATTCSVVFPSSAMIGGVFRSWVPRGLAKVGRAGRVVR
jgi:hypothetical protein